MIILTAKSYYFFEQEQVSVNVDGYPFVVNEGQVYYNNEPLAYSKVAYDLYDAYCYEKPIPFLILKTFSTSLQTTVAAMQKPFTIGSAIEDDIYILDPHIAKSQISIDPLKKTICDTKSVFCVYENGKIKTDTKYCEKAIYTIGTLKLMFLQNVIVVKHLTDTYISLPLQNISSKELLPFAMKEILSSYEPLPSLDFCFEIHCEKPPHAEQNTSLLHIGPTLTMSFTSLMIGLLMAYNNYQTAKSLRLVIPMLLFPSMMIVSTLLWYFVRKKIQEKTYQQAQQAYEDAFVYQLNQHEKAMHKTLHYYALISQNKYRSPDKIYHHAIIRHETNKMDNCDADYLTLYFGKRNYQPTFTLKTDSPQYLPVNLQERLTEFKNKLYQPQTLPFVYSLQNNRHLQIIDPTYRFTYAILTELAAYYRSEDVAFVTVGSFPSSFHFRFIKQILKTYDSVAAFTEAYETLSQSTYKRIIYLVFEDVDTRIFDANDMVLYFHAHISQMKSRIEIRESKGIYQNLQTKTKITFTPVAMERVQFEEFCIHVSKQEYNGKFHVGFCDLHDLCENIQEKITQKWQANHKTDRLIALIGKDEMGKVIRLDLHEAGQGPHGLIAGTTGSGKSEWIISLILSLAITYAPCDFQCIIIDYKGTGLTQALSYKNKRLPHIVGALSNLDESDVKRVLHAIKNECQTREQLFQKMHEIVEKDIVNIDVYRKVWKKESKLPYLARILIVVDEFAQLKKENPLFIDELIALARIGRSLGIHLLLSTQKPSGVVSAQIQSNTRYKVCLKVQSKEDAREVIDDSAAYMLQKSGEYYLRVDSQLSYGKSGYSAKRFVNKEEDIQIENEENVIDTSETEGNSEREEILKHMVSIALSKKPKQLWLPAKSETSLDELKDHQDCFGVIDDFYEGTYQFCKIRSPMIFLSDRIDCQTQLFHTLLYLVSKTDSPIYILTKTPHAYDAFVNHTHVCGIVDCDDDERLDILFHIYQKDGEMTVMIDDCAHFLTDSTERAEMMETWLRNSRDKFKLFVFMRHVKDMPHRYLDMIENRFVLSYHDGAIISEFLGQSYKSSFHSENQALIKYRNNIVKVTYPLVTIRDIQETSLPPVLKKMITVPKTIYVKKASHVIGVNVIDAKEIHLDVTRQIVFIGHDDRKIQTILSRLYKPEEYQFVYDAKKQIEKGICGMLIHTYEKHPLKADEDALVIFVGKGFQRQYILHAGIQRELKEDEGILFDHYVPTRIRFITGYQDA